MSSSDFPTRQLKQLEGHKGQVHAVTYSNGGAEYVNLQILTGATDRAIRLFNASTCNHVQSYNAHVHEILDIAVSFDNARFASGGGDKRVFLWDVATATTLHRYEGHTGRVEAVALGGEDDCTVISGGSDAKVHIWDTIGPPYKPIQTFAHAIDTVTSIKVIDKQIYAGSLDGKVYCYDIRMANIIIDVIAVPVTSVMPTMDNRAYIVTTTDSTIRMMSKKSGEMIQSFTAPGYINNSFRIRSTFGMEDMIVLGGSEAGEVFVWDVATGEERHRLSPFKDDVYKAKKVVSAVAFCPVRPEWVSGGSDGTVTVWGVDGA
ncbi:WD40 repeat-like protein [Rhizodiscina lignyota]|uniref:WD40 repeat-like protein n=1 Tax=Rhizodiscina lignyota TaxID=1504668 RepID=A0A9P4M286_9PEZI|nr:WD40 repeat-like protein [Rhizodiscina lignyota]